MKAIRLRFSAARARHALFRSSTVGFGVAASLDFRREGFFFARGGCVSSIVEENVTSPSVLVIAALDAAANKTDIFNGDAPGNGIRSPGHVRHEETRMLDLLVVESTCHDVMIFWKDWSGFISSFSIGKHLLMSMLLFKQGAT